MGQPLLNVSFTVNESKGMPELNFSVTVAPGSNIGQVLLFGVDAWDQDGSVNVDSSPPNFVLFQNPTPPDGAKDAFKCSWIGQKNAFYNGTLSGFNVLLGTQYAPSELTWFAYVTVLNSQNTLVPISVSGVANVTNAPDSPIPQ